MARDLTPRLTKIGCSGANGLLLIAAGCSLITSIWKVTTLQESLC
jgi:hypothetical protein